MQTKETLMALGRQIAARTVVGGVVILTGMLLLGSADAADSADERPNILFAFADDWSWPHAGAYGCEFVKRVDCWEEEATPKVFQPTRESLSTYEVPEWYRDAKIFPSAEASYAECETKGKKGPVPRQVMALSPEEVKRQQNATRVRVVIWPDEKKWVISEYLTGLHFVYPWEKDTYYDDGQVADWAKKHRANTARYPGGTASYWNWENPSGRMSRQASSLAPGWDGTVADRKGWMDIDEYLAFCKQSGMRPLIGVNYACVKRHDVPEAESVARAARQVKYLKDRGFAGAFWYIGNEDLHDAGGGGGKAAIPVAAKLFVAHAKAMKAVDPSIKILWNNNSADADFLKTFTALVGKWADGGEFHGKWPYGGKQLDRGVGTFQQWKTEAPLLDRKRNKSWRQKISELRQAAEDAGHPTMLLANNEYGLNGNASVLEGFNRYTKSLVVVDFLQELFIGGYDMACFWNNVSGGKNGAHKLMDADEGARMNPVRYGFELLGMAQGATMVKSRTDNRYVYGFSATTPENIQLYLINKTETAKTISIVFEGTQPAPNGKVAALRMVDTPDHWGAKESFAVRRDAKTGTYGGSLAPLSYSRIVFERSR